MISNVNQQSKQSFRGINVVYIPKKVFKHPDYISACEKEVKTIINKKNILASFVTAIRNIFSTLGLNGRKYVTRGDDVFEVIPKDGYHGFCVVTGNEKEKLVKELSLLNIYRVRKEMNFDDPGSALEAYKYIANKLHSEFNNIPRNTIELNSLSDLKFAKFVE